MFTRTLVATSLALAAGSALAQATVKDDGQMRSAIGLGASLASGNSKSSNLSLTADAVRATKQDKWSLYGSALRASSGGNTTAEQFRLGTRYDYDLTPQWFGFGGLDFDRNKFANLKLRSQLVGGIGWHVIKTPSTTWDLLAGAGYSTDKFMNPAFVDGATRSSYSYTSLFLGEESTHKLTDTTAFKQRLALYPNLKNSGEFRATFDAGLAVAMSKGMNLTVGLGMTHNSDPGRGRKATDTLLTTGIAMKFD